MPAGRRISRTNDKVVPSGSGSAEIYLGGRQKRGRQLAETVLEPDGEDDEDELSTSLLLEGDDLGDDPPGHRSGYVAVLGRPNAGKSTMLNALLGQKLSSVTHKAQTTRHRILTILSEPDYQMILLDTPGVMREERNQLDGKMMQNVRSARRDADILLALVDASDEPEQGLDLLQLSSDQSTSSLPVAVVLNKEVKQWIASKLPLGPTLYPKDDVADMPERFFVAEIIQEKIFQQYHEEVPYSSAVQVTSFQENEGRKDLIEVTVMVETASQRGIMIGAGGKALKRLGTTSRKDIEAFLGRPVFLDISVKVQDKWRKDSNQVMRFGY
ncbi:hypothetical protein WJX73_008810 [Symbiochloris irregularis]|uniref:KH type-2 domain-containing protein n=1 Tax=Symbiochloris irregularis TaxID=706552 RepID=A0AAW1Q006_9CHLO